MWAWILDNESFGARLDQGWSGTLSLPRVLSLDENGEMGIDVAHEIEALRYLPVKYEAFDLESGEERNIEGISGNSIELFIEIESQEALSCGMKVCASPDGEEQTVISYDHREKKLIVDTRLSGPEGTPKTVEAAPFTLQKGETLKLRIFVDRSVVEVFANGRQAVMRRIYPSRPDSLGVSLFSGDDPVRVRSLSCWQISPSNPY